LYLKPVAKGGTNNVPPKDEGTYKPDSQIWKKKKGLWIGHSKDHIPKSEDLARSEVYHSYAVDDEFGEQWLIPIIRSQDPSRGSLPVDVGWDDDGNYFERTKRKFQRLWEIAGKFRDMILGLIPKDERWMAEAVLEVLQLNYRVGIRELGMLDDAGNSVLDSERVATIGLCIIEFDLVEEHGNENQKKTDLEARDTPKRSLGPEDNIPTTSPVGVPLT
jgi:hypothetical protein